MPDIKASMSGSAWKVLVKPGDVVKVKDEVAILESMKMEIPIEAEVEGVVSAVLKQEGDFVQEGDVIVKLKG
ncbi:acetyl-CoA carboxylase biotin carboxyl carrier protein subunit [Geomicrobium sp. JCM 19055]|uniref:acetyl-CoA carboxylase biotin carboxyl carrier protein subunit n=1 Tax=Geomicrobium sp. JCM 19055 TaxID=1460649 RepID=UPI00045ED432|nr:acetyl-CoA carboxylase biotin carboxyl carrier protein subunit [Geomicrobium sp. JCM 19055]GAJ98068.1 biotin carboxyl carrier protein of methylcrotonyl-CoA carboxylase [Geomicrobium sp. JCM 19055]